MILGLRTVIYKVDDLERAKAWYGRAFEVEPYFDQPFYVGFQVGDYELGLDPDPTGRTPGPGGSVAYWGVEAIQPAFRRFLDQGTSPFGPPKDVGGGIQVATVGDPFGNVLGLIENPHFGKAGG